MGVGSVALNTKIIPSPLNILSIDLGRRAITAKYDKSNAHETAA
jgi:hypothetical protein